MRSFPAFVLVSGALLAAACTNDFDALIDVPGSGGAAASTSDAASSSGEPSASSGSGVDTTTGSSVVGSTASTGGGSTSDGGAGPGPGSGGAGGDSPGTGGEGSGGEAVASRPCEDIRLGLTNGAHPGWDELTSEPGDDVSIDVGSGTMRVDFANNQELELGYLARDLGDGDFDDCSVTTSVEALPGPIPDDLEVGGVLLAYADDNPLAGVAVARVHEPGNPPQTLYGILFNDGDGPVGYRGPRVPIAAPPPYALRMRNTDQFIAFDVRADGDWIEIDKIDHDDLDGDINRIVFGGALENEGDDEDSFNVTLGPVNP